MQKKVMIVVEEDGPGIKIYMAGDVERIYNNAPDLTVAELWGDKLFKVCVGVLQRTGTIKNIVDLSKVTTGPNPAGTPDILNKG